MQQPKHKILFIVQLPPPTHGVSVMNQHVVNNPLWKDKYLTRILPLHFGQTWEDIGSITFCKVIHMIAFFFKLFYILVSFRPDVVYFTIMPTGKVFYRDALFSGLIKLFRTRLVFHLHGKGIRESAQESSFKKWVYKKTFKNVFVICLSESLKKDIESIYTDEPFVLYNGIEEKNIAKTNNSNSIPVILFLSNLVKDKGIEVFLKSLVSLHQQRIPFMARIVGKPFDFSIEKAENFCREHNIANKVAIPGPKYNDEKLQELAQADIFVLPSFNECFPLAILEAMRAHLPIVATIVGGIPDMITHNKEGLLVQVNDADDLAEKLKLLLTNAELRYRLGQNAQEKFLAHYTICRFNEGLAHIFEKIINA